MQGNFSLLLFILTLIPNESIIINVITYKHKDYKEREEEYMNNLKEILYLIFNYPHKHYTFKHFEV